MTATGPKTDQIYYICEGCQDALNRQISMKQGKTVNCVAYGCERPNGERCAQIGIFRYIYDRLKEKGMLKEKSDEASKL